MLFQTRSKRGAEKNRPMLNPAERKIETSFFLILIKWIVWCQMLSCVLFIYLLIRQPTCTLFCHRLL